MSLDRYGRRALTRSHADGSPLPRRRRPPADDAGRCTRCGRFGCPHLERACARCYSLVTVGAGVSWPELEQRRWCLRCGAVFPGRWSRD